MSVGRVRVLVALALASAALAGCAGKKSGAAGLKKKWLSAKWVPVAGELEDGVAFAAEIPEGLPQNTEALVGKDWWVGTGVPVERMGDAAGPRLSLYKPKPNAYADAEAFASHVEEPRPDLVVLGKEKLADGRLRFAHAVKGNSHIRVSVWIPVDDARGVECTAHWWKGVDMSGRKEKDAPPDLEIVAWLDRFCQSVKLTPR